MPMLSRNRLDASADGPTADPWPRVLAIAALGALTAATRTAVTPARRPGPTDRTVHPTDR